jgi:hypothetical protein
MQSWGFRPAFDRLPAMNDYAKELDALLDLDTRHDDLLRRLEELDKQVEAVLSQWLTQREGTEARTAG